MSKESFPTQDEIDEVTSGDFSQVQSPAEAWDVTEEDISTVDQETIALSE